MVATPLPQWVADRDAGDGEELGRMLYESDAEYNEAGAVVEPFEGASLAFIPGLAALPAAAVVQRVNPAGIRAPLHMWFEEIEQRFATLGASLTRVCLQRPTLHVETVLRRRGYQPREETGYLAAAATPVTGRGDDAADLAGFADEQFEFRAVEGDRAWAAKEKFHAADEHGPDGKPADPARWVAMERRRADAGCMRPYLVWLKDAPVAAMGISANGRLLRIRNLVVHSELRRRGIGLAVVRAAMALAASAGWNQIGCFAAPGTAPARMFESAGFRPLIRQTEWTRLVGPV